MELLKEIDTII